jgi:hypothetical protein
MADVRYGGLDDEALQLLLKEEWREYIAVCSRIVDGACDRRVLCSALAHRADARARLRDFRGALADCDAALAEDPAHPGALLSKGGAAPRPRPVRARGRMLPRRHARRRGRGAGARRAVQALGGAGEERCD